MKQIRHIVRKDLLRLRWLLVGWVGVLLLPILLGFRLLAHNPLGEEHWTAPQIYAGCLVLEGLAAYLLTLLLIQEDPLVGTRQFWLTRPIGRRQLALAKMTGAAVILGVIPLLVSLPWWWWCGFRWCEIAVAASELGALATLVALPAALVAALTDSLSRALLWTMVAFAVLMVVALFFGAVTLLVIDQPSAALWISRDVLAIALLAFQIGILILAQYRAPLRIPSLVTALVVMVGSLWAASQSTLLLVGRVRPHELNAGKGSDVNVNLKSMQAWRLAAGGVKTARGIENLQRISTGFTVTGVPAGLMLAGLGAEQHWQFGAGPELTWADYLSGYGGSGVSVAGLRAVRWEEFSGDEETLRWMAEGEAVRNIRTVQRMAEGEAELATSAFFSPSLVVRMQTKPPTYRAKLWLELAHPRLDLEVPLAPGGWHRGAGWGMRVDAVDLSRGPRRDMKPGGGAIVRIVDTTAAPVVTALRDAARRGTWFDFRGAQEHAGYMALNRERGVFVPQHSFDARSITVNGVRVAWRSLGFDAPHIIRQKQWTPVPGWMTGVTLGKVSMQPEAVFARDVATDRFEPKLAAKP